MPTNKIRVIRRVCVPGRLSNKCVVRHISTSNDLYDQTTFLSPSVIFVLMTRENLAGASIPLPCSLQIRTPGVFRLLLVGNTGRQDDELNNYSSVPLVTYKGIDVLCEQCKVGAIISPHPLLYILTSGSCLCFVTTL